MPDQQSARTISPGSTDRTDPPADLLRGAPRVLVVDDDPGQVLVMQETLAEAGFTVEVGASGAEAIEACSEFMPDLVLLDINMPEIDGIEACEEIRRQSQRQFPIIMVTSVDDAVSIQRAFDAGANDFILKPLNWPLFQRRLSAVLAEWNRSRELDENCKRVQLLEKIAPRYAILVSRDGRIVEDLKNRPEKKGDDPAATDQTLEDLFGAEIASRFKQRISGVLKTGRHNSLEFSRTEQGIRGDYEAQFLVEGRERVIVIVQHVTAEKGSQAEVFDLAFCDPVTKLPNWHLFKRCADETLVEARLRGCSLAFVNLCFDEVSTKDLANGDLMLAIADRLGECLAICTGILQMGKNDTTARVARVAANQFMFMLENMQSKTDVSAVCDRLVEGFTGAIEIDSGSITLEPRLGVGIYPADGQDLQTLMRAADAALHEAQETGRTLCFNSQPVTEQTEATLDYGVELRQAMESGQLELYFQPRWSMPDASITCVEALMRWNHPMRGFVSMSELLHLAISTGLIVPLGDWVLLTACEEARRWGGASPPRVSINLSQQEFTRQDLADRVIDVLDRTSLEPHRIELELTEGALLRTENGCAELETLKRLGVGLVLDDFGTGHTSLAHLKQYPIDALKIDGSFVGDLPGNEANAAICDVIITIAHKFGMKAVAEGVETQAQLDFLCDMGCDEFQGFHLCKPLPASEIGAFVSQFGQPGK